MVPNNSFGVLGHYLYLVGVSERILSLYRKSRIFGSAILKISQYSTMLKFDGQIGLG